MSGGISEGITLQMTKDNWASMDGNGDGTVTGLELGQWFVQYVQVTKTAGLPFSCLAHSTEASAKIAATKTCA